MSRFNYAKLSNLALDKITQFGQPVTITHRSEGSYNVTTSENTVTETTQTTSGLVETYSNKEIDGTLVQIGDIKLTLPASGITKPSVDDNITLEDSAVYTIKSVDIVSPGGTPIIYTCQIRK